MKINIQKNRSFLCFFILIFALSWQAGALAITSFHHSKANTTIEICKNGETQQQCLQELEHINDNPATLAGSYLLDNDIVIPDGVHFIPIGPNLSQPFTGSFDGDSHTISNIKIVNHSFDSGLFGVISNTGSVLNLGVKNISIISGPANDAVAGIQAGRFGGFVGQNSGFIANCYVDNKANQGGISYQNSTDVSGIDTENIGGFAGQNVGSNGAILDAYARNVDITVKNGAGDIAYNVGGFVGDNSGYVNESWYLGKLTVGYNPQNVGGFVGENIPNPAPPPSPALGIYNSYAQGEIIINNLTGGNYIGGFVGQNYANAHIEKVYSAMKANISGGATNVGGFVGYPANVADIVYSYWDNNIFSGGITPDSVNNFEGKPTSQMRLLTSGTIYQNWDPSVWFFVPGPYPTFKFHHSILTGYTDPAVSGVAVGLAANGTNISDTITLSDGKFNLPILNNDIGANDALLFYLENSANKGNLIFFPNGNGSMPNNLTIYGNALYLYFQDGSAPVINNDTLSAIKGSLSGSYILFNVDAGGVSIPGALPGAGPYLDFYFNQNAKVSLGGCVGTYYNGSYSTNCAAGPLSILNIRKHNLPPDPAHAIGNYLFNGVDIIYHH